MFDIINYIIRLHEVYMDNVLVIGSGFLGKNVVNLSRIPRKYDWKSLLFVNETKYKNYIETYTKQSGTPEKPVWDIVIDRMETDLI